MVGVKPAASSLTATSKSITNESGGDIKRLRKNLWDCDKYDGATITQADLRHNAIIDGNFDNEGGTVSVDVTVQIGA